MNTITNNILHFGADNILVSENGGYKFKKDGTQVSISDSEIILES